MADVRDTLKAKLINYLSSKGFTDILFYEDALRLGFLADMRIAGRKVDCIASLNGQRYAFIIRTLSTYRKTWARDLLGTFPVHFTKVYFVVPAHIYDRAFSIIRHWGLLKYIDILPL